MEVNSAWNRTLSGKVRVALSLTTSMLDRACVVSLGIAREVSSSNKIRIRGIFMYCLHSTVSCGRSFYRQVHCLHLFQRISGKSPLHYHTIVPFIPDNHQGVGQDF